MFFLICIVAAGWGIDPPARMWRKSLSCAGCAAVVGLHSGIVPAGMCLPAARLASEQNHLSPAKMHVGEAMLSSFL